MPSASGCPCSAGLRPGWLITQSPTAAVALGALVAGAVVVAGLSVPNQEVRCFTVVAAVFSAACFVIPVWLRGVSEVLSNGPLAEASRYQVVPLLLLVSILLVAAGDLARPNGARPKGAGVARSAHAGPVPSAGARRPGWRAAAVPVACAVLLLPSWVADFRDANPRSAGPVWPAQLARAAAHCRDSHTATATVRIDPPGWKAVLVCQARPGACRCLGSGGVRCPGACGQGALRGRRLVPSLP